MVIAPDGRFPHRPDGSNSVPNRGPAVGSPGPRSNAARGAIRLLGYRNERRSHHRTQSVPWSRPDAYGRWSVVRTFEGRSSRMDPSARTTATISFGSGSSARAGGAGRTGSSCTEAIMSIPPSPAPRQGPEGQDEGLRGPGMEKGLWSGEPADPGPPGPGPAGRRRGVLERPRLGDGLCAHVRPFL